MASAKNLWLLVPVSLVACSKPVPTECPAWDPAATPEREVCGEDALVRRVGSATCDSGCTSDDDCEAGTLCACGDTPTSESRCEPTGCRSAEDCESGFDCIGHISDECGSELVPSFGFQCQTADDDCALDADCAEGQFCRFVDAEGLHRCFDQEAFSCG